MRAATWWVAGLMACAGTAALAQVGNREVPRLIPYMGTLEQGGRPAASPVSMRFALFNVGEGGTQLWAETHPVVAVSGGRFSVVLGSITPLPAPVLHEPNLYLAVEVNGVALGARQRLLPALYALRTQGAVPLGTILDWYAFDGSTAVPEGFAVCDGTTLNDPASPYHGRVLPNLLDDRVTMGVPRARMGERGGRNDLPVDGNHAHGGETGTFTNWIPGHANWVVQPGADTQWHHRHAIGADGNHSHGGENRQRYQGVLKIMRVR